MDNEQELLACSLCNTVGAFFGCIVATQAPPRTLVHETAGGRTQLAGAVSTLVPLVVVLALGPLFEALPVSVLGCITSCAILPLMKQFTQLRQDFARLCYLLRVYTSLCIIDMLLLQHFLLTMFVIHVLIFMCVVTSSSTKGFI